MTTTRREAIAGGIALAATAGLPAAATAKAQRMSEVLDTHDCLGLAGLVAKRKVSAAELLESKAAGMFGGVDTIRLALPRGALSRTMTTLVPT